MTAQPVDDPGSAGRRARPMSRLDVTAATRREYAHVRAVGVVLAQALGGNA